MTITLGDFMAQSKLTAFTKLGKVATHSIRSEKRELDAQSLTEHRDPGRQDLRHRCTRVEKSPVGHTFFALFFLLHTFL